MQEALHGVHAHNDTQGNIKEQVHPDENDENIGRCNTTSNSFLQKDFRQLSMGEGKSPQTEIWGRVRNATKNKFYGLDYLMDGDLADVVMGIVSFCLNWFVAGSSFVLCHHLFVFCVNFVYQLFIQLLGHNVVLAFVFFNGLVMGFLGHLEENDQGFEYKHDWNAGNGHNQENILKLLLALLIPKRLSFSWTQFQWHGYHLANNWRSLWSWSFETPMNCPFVNNEYAHVTESTEKEHLLR